METHVHYPTDSNLLYDAVRVLLRENHQLHIDLKKPGYRQANHTIKKTKHMLHEMQERKRRLQKSKTQKDPLNQEYQEICQNYISHCEQVVEKAEQSQSDLSGTQQSMKAMIQMEVIETMIHHAKRQIDQFRRRVIEGETIPHEEKVFSIFQPHTEWIVKGKAGVSQELGLKVGIVKDQYGLILTHQVIQKAEDADVCVGIAKKAQEWFPEMSQCSFDKGCYSQENKRQLNEFLDRVIMPKSGKRSKAEATEESTEDFKQARHQHAAVESSINALEQHGLDVCMDHGIEGFKRYVAFAIVSRNIQILGKHLIDQIKPKTKRRDKPRLQKAA